MYYEPDYCDYCVNFVGIVMRNRRDGGLGHGDGHGHSEYCTREAKSKSETLRDSVIGYRMPRMEQ